MSDDKTIEQLEADWRKEIFQASTWRMAAHAARRVLESYDDKTRAALAKADEIEAEIERRKQESAHAH